VARARSLDEAEWHDGARRAAHATALTHTPRLLVSAAVAVPMTYGCWRPGVLLPADYASWPAARRYVVLLHEFAHVARRDALTHLMASLTCAVHWFNPAVWYAARRLRVERERACDDFVVEAGTPAA